VKNPTIKPNEPLLKFCVFCWWYRYQWRQLVYFDSFTS